MVVTGVGEAAAIPEEQTVEPADVAEAAELSAEPAAERAAEQALEAAVGQAAEQSTGEVIAPKEAAEVSERMEPAAVVEVAKAAEVATEATEATGASAAEKLSTEPVAELDGPASALELPGQIAAHHTFTCESAREAVPFVFRCEAAPFVPGGFAMAQAEMAEPLTFELAATVDSMAAEASEEQVKQPCGPQGQLPIWAEADAICRAVRSHSVAVVVAETGSGKSTQLPQMLDAACVGGCGRVLCTQPRKIAAISLAQRVASECGRGPLGGHVGYKVGCGNERMSHSTRLLFCTDRVAVRMLQEDPSLPGIGVVIADEAHERSLWTDLLLAALKRSLTAAPHLRVVITSATIDPTVFQSFFARSAGGSEATEGVPVISAGGRVFPVSVQWLQASGRQAGGKTTLPAEPLLPDPAAVVEPAAERAATDRAVEEALRIHRADTGKGGHMLVFLTSPAEVERAVGAATAAAHRDPRGLAGLLPLPLHGRLTMEDQQRVFAPVRGRKLVFATNVAETSVTVDGVGVVIDTGLAKEVSFDARRGTTALAVRRISQSAAEQRRGRAGRTRAGLCLRLFSEHEFATMEPRGVPELLRVSLSHAVTQLLEFGVEDVLAFEMIDSPSPEALRSALRELTSVGAIVPRPGGGQLLTPLGRQLAALPVEVRLGSMALLGQERGVGDAAAICAVLMSSSGIFFRGFSNEERAEADIAKLQFCRTEGDVLTMLDVYRAWSRIPESQQNAWCVEHSVNAKSMRGARDTLREMRFTMTNALRLPRPKGKGLAVSSAAEADALVRLIFDCFADAGCCIYRGHPRLGYSMLGFECAEEALKGAAKEATIQKPREPQADVQTEGAQKQATLTEPNGEEGEAETALQELVQQILLHPSSAHCALGITPDWITYTRLHRTSAQFAMGVTAVNELHVQRYWGAALVARAVASLRVERLPDKPFGAGVLWQLLGPSPKKLEERLCSLSGGPVVLEAERLDLGSGDGQTAGQQRRTWAYSPWPQVFVAASNREAVEVELSRRVAALREAFAAESEVRTFGPGGRCSAMRGQGGHVRELMPPEGSARSLQALLVCEWRLRECSEYEPQQPHLVTHEDVSSHLESLGCPPSVCVPSWDLGRVAGVGPGDRPVCSACFASLEEAARARTAMDKSWQQWSWLQHAWVGLLHLSRSQPLLDITDHFSRGPADVRTLMVQMFASRMLAVPWQQKQHVEILNTLLAENPHGGGGGDGGGGLSVIQRVVVAVQRLLERMMADLGMASADADGRKAKSEIGLFSEGESSDGSVAELGQECLSQAEPDFWDCSTMPQWTPDVAAALLHNAFCLLGRVLTRSSTHRHRSAPHKELARLQIFSLFERLCCAPEPGGRVSRGTRERKAKKRGRQPGDGSEEASQGGCLSRFSLLAGLLASQGQTIFYAFLNGGMVDVMLQQLEACVQQAIQELETAEPPEGSFTLLSQAFEFLSTAPSSKGTSKGLRGGADIPAALRRLTIYAANSVASACRQLPVTAMSILACIIPHLDLNASSHPAFDNSMLLGGYESARLLLGGYQSAGFGGGLAYAGYAVTSSISGGHKKLLVTAVTAWSELQRLQLESGDSEAAALMWEASHVLGQLLKSQIIGDSLTPDTACTVLQQLELAGGSPGTELPSEVEARRDALLLRFLWLVHRSAVNDVDRGGQRWNLLDCEWCMALQASVTLSLDAAWPQAGKLNQPHGGQAASASQQSELKPHLARWAIQTLVELAGTEKDEITAVSKSLSEVAGRLWPPQEEGAPQQAGSELVSQRLSFMLLLEALLKQQCFSRGLSLVSQGRPMDPTDDHGICLRAVAEWAAANAQRDPGYGNFMEDDLPKLETTACVACRLALHLPMQHADNPERARAVLFRACGVVLAPLSGSPTAKAAEGAARLLSSLVQDVLSAGTDRAGLCEEGETAQPGLRHEATGAAMLLSLLDSWLPSAKQLPKEGPVSQTGMLATLLCMGTLAGLGCPTPQKALLGRLSAAAALALRAAARLAVDLPEARQKAASTAKVAAEVPAPAGRKARRRPQKESDGRQPTAAANAAAARLASLQSEVRSWAALAECIDATAAAVQADRFWPYPWRGDQGLSQEDRQDSLPLEDASLVELARAFGIRRRGPIEGPIDGKRAASVEPSAFLGALRSAVESGQTGDLITGTWCLEGTSLSIVKQDIGVALQYDGNIGRSSCTIPLYPLAAAADKEDLQVTPSLQWTGGCVGVKVLLSYDPVPDSLRVQSKRVLQLQSGEAVRCQQRKSHHPPITTCASATAARPEEEEALKGAFELLSRRTGHAAGSTFFSEEASRRLANALTAGARAAVGRELRRLELGPGQCVRAGPLRPIEDGLRVEALVGRRSYLGHGFVEWSSWEDWSRAQEAFLGWLNREFELPDGLHVVLSLNSAEHASTTWGYRVALDPNRLVTEAELKSAVDTAVKLWGGAGGKKGGRVGCTAKVVVTEKFHDFPAGLERLQVQLHELCPSAVHVQVAPPHAGDMDYKVVFHGLRPEQASDVPQALAGVRFQQDAQRDRKAPPPRVECRFAASAQLGRAVLSASSVAAELVRLRKELEADGLELRAHDAKGGRRESVEYEVLGRDAARVAGACKELCRLGTGRSVPIEEARAFRKAADPSFRGILRQVAEDTRTHVLLDRRTCALCVFGSTVAQRDAEVALRGLLAPERLDFFIDRGHLSGQALKGLFATYGKQLGGFRDVLPEGVTMDFDVAHALLTVRSCSGAEPGPKMPSGQPSCTSASGSHSRCGRGGASSSAASGSAGDKKWKKKEPAQEAPAGPEPLAEVAEDSRHSPLAQAEASIAACLRAAGSRPRQADRPSADCVVCFCPIEEEAPFFLELCGHAVCTACAANQVRSGLGLGGLPLRCAREGCGTLFALEDIRQLARRGLLDERRLFEAALSEHVRGHQDTVRFCPTPDCQSIYTVTDDCSSFLCGLCGVEVCAAHHERQVGGTCSKTSRSLGVSAWIGEDPARRKRCPKCSIGLEKVGGCEHVTCLACKAHMCWQCLKVFEEASECYRHLREVHGSIGLGEGAGLF